MTSRVLIVDDHAGFRRLARSLLEQEGFTVAGEAATGRPALSLAEHVSPDAVRLDIRLPDADRFAVCRDLRVVLCPASST